MAPIANPNDQPGEPITYDYRDSMRKLDIVTQALCLTLSSMCIGLRMYSKLFIMKTPGWEDCELHTQRKLLYNSVQLNLPWHQGLVSWPGYVLLENTPLHSQDNLWNDRWVLWAMQLFRSKRTSTAAVFISRRWPSLIAESSPRWAKRRPNGVGGIEDGC